MYGFRWWTCNDHKPKFVSKVLYAIVFTVADPAFRQGGGQKNEKLIDYPLAAKQPPHA